MSVLAFRQLSIKKKKKSRNMSSKGQKRKKQAIKKAITFGKKLEYKIHKSMRKYLLKKERKNIWDRINEDLIK
ncbi:hypothetical protein PCANB_000468 [Pneumocystis canis]|nr:hypothetical protein PCANB_000468 [Pneumocystis canis]